MDQTPYQQMFKEANIPTTEEGIKAEWDKINTASDVKIQNDSAWSPFWRLITAIVTKPAVWLTDMLKNHVLPNAFLKDATGQWLDLLAWAVDLERKQAAKARGNIIFTRENSEGEIKVEAGILVATPAINGKVYRVKTLETITFAAGTTGGPVPVEAEFPGTAHNLGPGYYKVLPEPVDGIASVTNEADWLSTAGADEEKDESLRLRARNQYSAVGQYHHDAAYRADIASFAGIATNYIWFEHGAPRGPGTANAYIMVDSGCPTQAFVDQINTHVRDKGHHGHGDDMLCKPMPASPKALEVTVYHPAALDTVGKDALKAAVTDRVRNAFRENQDYAGITRTMPFSRFSFSRLADELHGQVPEIESVSFSLQDIKSAMALPTLDSLIVILEVS